jgi:hypothetical protein
VYQSVPLFRAVSIRRMVMGINLLLLRYVSR